MFTSLWCHLRTKIKTTNSFHLTVIKQTLYFTGKTPWEYKAGHVISAECSRRAFSFFSFLWAKCQCVLRAKGEPQPDGISRHFFILQLFFLLLVSPTANSLPIESYYFTHLENSKPFVISTRCVCCTCLAYFNQRPDNSRPAALHVPEEGWKKRRDGYNKEKNDNGASLPSWGNVRYRQGEPPSSTLKYFPHISVRFFKYLNFEFTLNDSQLTNVTSFRDLWGLSTCILLRISVYQTKNR